MHVFLFQSGSLMCDYRFAGETVTVGSSATCLIALPDTRVAPVHVRLAPRKDGAWWAVPAESVDAPAINGSPLRVEHHLKEMDEITIGPFLLRFYFSEFGKQHAARQYLKRDHSTLLDGAVLLTPDDSVSLSRAMLRDYSAATAALSGIESTDELAQRVLSLVCERFKTRIACLRAPARPPAQGWHSHCAGQDGDAVDPPPVFSLMQSQCEHHGLAVGMPGLAGSGAGMAAPLPDGAAGLAAILFAQMADSTTTVTVEEVGRFAAFATLLGPMVERCLNAPPRIAVDHVDDMARVIQDAITPTTAPNWAGMQVAAYRRNGTASVSDVYDMLRLANGTSSFMVGRVNAQGAPLARLLTEAWTAFRTGGLHSEPPQALIRTINWLAHDGRAAYTIDAATAWLNGATGAAQVCVAGTGVWVGLIPSGGEYQDLTATHGPAVGQARGFGYQAGAFGMEAGDTLVMGTAGVDSIVGRDGGTMGRAAAIEILTDLAGRSPSVMLSGLASELDEFSAGGGTPEDITVLVVRRQ